MGMQKKMERVYIKGLTDGATHANELWLDIIENTKGIGPKTREKILTEASRQVKGFRAEDSSKVNVKVVS